MAHYAYINESYIVVDVFVGKDETNFDWEQYYGSLVGMLCKRTSFNTRGGIYYEPNSNIPAPDQTKAYRKNYAGIGYIYDAQRDAFIPPKPFASWVLDEFSCLWAAPIPYPDDGGSYIWNEETLSWVRLENDE